MPTFPSCLCRRPPNSIFICLEFLLCLASPSRVGSSGLAFHASTSQCATAVFIHQCLTLPLGTPRTSINTLVSRLTLFLLFGFLASYRIIPTLFSDSQSHHGCTRQSSASHKLVILPGFRNPDHHGQGGKAVYQ